MSVVIYVVYIPLGNWTETFRSLFGFQDASSTSYLEYIHEITIYTSGAYPTGDIRKKGSQREPVRRKRVRRETTRICHIQCNAASIFEHGH